MTARFDLCAWCVSMSLQGASLSSLQAADDDQKWLSLSIVDVLNDALATSLAKTLPACVPSDDSDGGHKHKGSADGAYQMLHALGELLGSAETSTSAKSSPLVRRVWRCIFASHSIVDMLSLRLVVPSVPCTPGCRRILWPAAGRDSVATCLQLVGTKSCPHAAARARVPSPHHLAVVCVLYCQLMQVPDAGAGSVAAFAARAAVLQRRAIAYVRRVKAGAEEAAASAGTAAGDDDLHLSNFEEYVVAIVLGRRCCAACATRPQSRRGRREKRW